MYIGNLDSLRDWGHAKDFVEAMYLVLQQEEPDDYVIATGKQYSVRHFIEVAGAQLGMSIKWEGDGLDEVGIDGKSGKRIIAVDSRYFRPTEVDTLLGDPSRAKEKLGWEPKIGMEQLVEEMIRSDLHEAKRDAMVADAGYKSYDYHE